MPSVSSGWEAQGILFSCLMALSCVPFTTLSRSTTLWLMVWRVAEWEVLQSWQRRSPQFKHLDVAVFFFFRRLHISQTFPLLLCELCTPSIPFRYTLSWKPSTPPIGMIVVSSHFGQWNLSLLLLLSRTDRIHLEHSECKHGRTFGRCKSFLQTIQFNASFCSSSIFPDIVGKSQPKHCCINCWHLWYAVLIHRNRLKVYRACQTF